MYANKLVTTRRAIKNTNAYRSQVMEPGASSNPPDVIAKCQAIQGDDTPADTIFHCINLEDNPIRDVSWLAFEELSTLMVHDALKKHLTVQTQTWKG
eukprot:877718-Pelagomonas_calceolata.AAC.1